MGVSFFRQRLQRRVRNHEVNRLPLEQLEDRRLLTAQLDFDMGSLRVDPTYYDDSSILVRFRPQDDTGLAMADLAKGAGIVGETKSKSLLSPATGLRKVTLSDTVDVQTALSAYRNDPSVLYAEPNFRVFLAETIPDDTRFDEIWALNNEGQNGGKEDADIDAPLAWDVTQGSGGTVVAVLDTGVDHNHPDLTANMWVNLGELPGDGVDNDGNGYVDDVHGYDFFNRDANPLDDHGHGTHVAGTIGAQGNNGVGVAGINWDVQIMALKFLGADGSGTTADAIEALQYAVANGASISNNSWGGDPYSQALYDAIEAARAAGHIFVAAAGNGDAFGNGIDNDGNPFYPAGYDLDNILAVAATNRNDDLAVFSNYGATTVDLAAPGVDILSTIPGGGYGLSTGTSMAAPHATGVTTLVQDLHPDWDYQQVLTQVLASVDPLPELYGVTVTGGRLNAAAAVGNPEPPPPPPEPGTLPIFEGFGDGVADYFRPEVGNWDVSGGRLTATPVAENHELPAVSTLDLSHPLPANLEVQATVKANEGRVVLLGLVLSNHLTNGYLVFDYHGPEDFKYAGADMWSDRWVIGHRDASGWNVDAALNETLNAETSYSLRLLIENGDDVRLFGDGIEKVTHSYGASVTGGELGMGARDSTTHFDSIYVREYFASTSAGLPILEDFNDGRADQFQPRKGTSYVSADRYRVVSAVDGDGVSTIRIDGGLPTDLEIEATIYGESIAGFSKNSLIIFDYQSATDFKYAGAYMGGNLWAIGRRTASGWVKDVQLSQTIDAETDYRLEVVITNGTQVQLSADGLPKLTYTYGDSLIDGAVGVGTQKAVSQFDDVVVQAFVAPPPPPSGSLPIVEDFDDGVADYFEVNSGDWNVAGDRYRAVPPVGGDGVSTVRVDGALPLDLEIEATIHGESVSGFSENALIIFDYQSATDFKYAGAYIGGNLWAIGRRTASGWVKDVQVSQTIDAGTDYRVEVVITNGTEVQLLANGVPKLTHVYGESLIDGAVGVGTQMAVSQFDDVVVQAYVPPPPPPSGSLPIVEDFDDGVADYFQVHSGDWSVTGDRYRTVPPVGGDGVSTVRVDGALPLDLEIEATIFGESVSGFSKNALIIFDYQSATNFKYAGAYIGGNLWAIGRRTASGWVKDVQLSQTIDAETDYRLEVVISNGTQVQLLANGVPKLTHFYSESLIDGEAGVGTQMAVSQFDDVVVQAYVPPPPPPSGSLPIVEDFDDGVADYFEVHSGDWNVTGDRYRAVPPVGGDGVSTVRVDGALPLNLEIEATIHGESVSGFSENALIIFDYQSATDFKYAGAYIGGNLWAIGRRTASGWVKDMQLSQTIDAGTDYRLEVVITNGTEVQLLANGVPKLTHVYAGSLTDGAVGVGTQMAVSQFDDVVVQAFVTPPPPPSGTLPIVEDFDDGVADYFQVHSGDWSVTGDRYRTVPPVGGDGVSTVRVDGALPLDLEIEATIFGESVSGFSKNALIIFDYQSATNFKYAGAYIGGNLWAIGRRTASGWVKDVQFSQTLYAETDYRLEVVITNGTEVQLLVNGVPKLTHAYGEALNDGAVGVGTQKAVSQFDDIVVQGYAAQSANALASDPVPPRQFMVPENGIALMDHHLYLTYAFDSTNWSLVRRIRTETRNVAAFTPKEATMTDREIAADHALAATNEWRRWDLGN